MYHPESPTYAIYRRRSTWRIVLGVFVALALVVGVFAWTQGAVREQGAASLRQAILSSALECYAIEGAYPATLEYLEDHYALVVNRRDFVVNYEWFASNVAPSVAVVAR